MGGITLLQIVDAVSTAITTDAAISAWCVTEYGTPPTIMLGMDMRDRPGADKCPLILLRAGTVREVDGMYQYEVQIDWAVYDDAVTVVDGITEYVGVRRLDALGQLLWTAVQTLSGILQAQQSEYVLETVEKFPMCLGAMDVTFNVPAMLCGQLTL